jgi:hypothetical protein
VNRGGRHTRSALEAALGGIGTGEPLGQPLVVAGSFNGVVGADVLVAWFEGRLLEVMDAVDLTCLLVNAAGSVVTSSDPTWVTGDLLRDLPVEEWLSGDLSPHPQWRATVCDGQPFVVLTPR